MMQNKPHCNDNEHPDLTSPSPGRVRKCTTMTQHYPWPSQNCALPCSATYLSVIRRGGLCSRSAASVDCKKANIGLKWGNSRAASALFTRGCCVFMRWTRKAGNTTSFFFAEGMFPGSMTALLEGSASSLAIQALEDCILLEID